MKILSWYVAKDFTRYLLLCLTAMALLLLAAKLFNDIDSAFSSLHDFFLFLEEVVQALPKLFEIITPVAVLLATVITFTGISRTSELLAIQCSGVGNFRLILPIFVALLPFVVLIYLNQNYLFAALNDTGKPRSTKENINQWRSARGNIYFLGKTNRKENRVEGGYIFHHQTNPFQLFEITSFSTGQKTESGWVLKRINRQVKQPDRWFFERTPQREVPIAQIPDLFKPLELDAHHMPFLALNREIRQLEKRDPHVVVYNLEWYQKTAVLFAPFILVMIAAPLSQSHFRKGRAAGEMIITLFGGLVYWIGNETFLILGKGGAFHPFVAAWGINLGFFVLGVLLLRFAR